MRRSPDCTSHGYDFSQTSRQLVHSYSFHHHCHFLVWSGGSHSVVAWQHSTIMATTCVHHCTCNESCLLHHWHAHTCTYVCTVPTTLLTLKWRRSSCCSNIQQCLALETHSAMHGGCKQTKTVETTQHRYTCAFSYVQYIYPTILVWYIRMDPAVFYSHPSHMHTGTPSSAHLLAACSTDMFICTL